MTGTISLDLAGAGLASGMKAGHPWKAACLSDGMRSKMQGMDSPVDHDAFEVA